MTLRALLLVMMSVGWWRVPAAFSSEPVQLPTMRRAGLVAVSLVGFLALVSGPVLETLEVDTETFRIATGLAVVGLGLARVLGWGSAAEEPTELANGWLWPVAYPVLIGPELILVAVSVGSDHGVIVTALSAAVGVLLAVLVADKDISYGVDEARVGPLSVIGVRGAGVVLVLLAVAQVFDGLRDV